MPNIENLKKQAKQYLRWHRERYYPVAPRIRAALPRFRHFSDQQVLDANFKLADAQELFDHRHIQFDCHPGGHARDYSRASRQMELWGPLTEELNQYAIPLRQPLTGSS
jgi:hypothetical protein